MTDRPQVPPHPHWPCSRWAWEHGAIPLGVRLTPHGNMEVSGKPFFPLMIYCASTSEQMKECAGMGFNVGFGGPYPREQRHGLYTVMRYTPELDEGGWLANFIMDKPDHYTKPDGSLIYPPDWVRAEVVRGKAEHPHVPSIVFLSAQVADDLTTEYITTGVDIIALDFCQRDFNRPISLLPPLMERINHLAHRAVGKPKPLWVILQVVASNMAASTPEENRALTYMALVHGANGLGWWAYLYATHYDENGAGVHSRVQDIHPALWASMRRLCCEVSQMAEALSADRPVEVQRAGTVAYREVWDDQHHWVLAVEELGVAQFPELTVHLQRDCFGDQEARVLTEARNVSVADSPYGLRIRDGFKPFEAHAYCFRLRQGAEPLPPVPMLGRGGYF